MIKHIKINPDNLEFAIKLHSRIFEEFDASEVYEMSASGENNAHYFIVFDGDTAIGVSGLYTMGADPENCWLGWFGIVPELRRQGKGRQALRLVEETARDLGFRFMRVIIAKNHCDDATIPFLKSNGYKPEPYDCPRDQISQKEDCTVFTRTFYQEAIIPWNSKNIHFTDMLEKSKK